MAEISIPVKLQIQNLQSIVSELQGKLANLKVGSTGFKSMQSLISSISNEIDRLQVQTSKPFMNAGQFTAAERSVEKLEDQFERIGIAINRIKFSDLNLNPAQQADLKAFEDQINQLKTSLKTVKETAKQDFLKSDLGNFWKDNFDKAAAAKSLSQITNAISREVTKQETEFNRLKAISEDYTKALDQNKSIEGFLNKYKNTGKFSPEILGEDLYSKVFNKKDYFRNKDQGKNLISQWLEQQFKIDPNVIQQILSKSDISGLNIFAKLKEGFTNQLNNNKNFIGQNTGATTAADAQKVKYEQLITVLNAAMAAQSGIVTSEQAIQTAITGVNNDLNQYTQNLVNGAQAEFNYSNASSQMHSQLDNLRNTLNSTNAQFLQMERVSQSFNQMKMAIVNFMGFNQVLNITRNAIKEAVNHIKELDTVMNGISIVTDMSTADLWDQVDAYSKLAQTYGVSIKGAYEVSQIYYQQGLETKDVMTLTNETLKLAKISGLDYATTTDYMTTAIRGFKMEMSDAATVVDVYSNLAANTAVSQEELAVAMSKTASSMEGVGATFEESSAMIATMVAVTRESATNIGSAMKSIASRYGELTKDPTKLVDADGEAMAFNKVDLALQSVGISMKTVDGQFRELTDVVVELAEKWDTLDSTQQRYIATQFAGNRQQSRFLALVSNKDLLNANLQVARNSEDTGTLQALKALDSIESKLNQVQVAYQQFYTTVGVENVWKGLLDGTKNVINTLNSLPKLFGKIPASAIVMLAGIIKMFKDLAVNALNGFAQTFGTNIVNGIIAATPQAEQGANNIINTIAGVFKGSGGKLSGALQAATQQAVATVTTTTTTIKPEQLTGENKIKYQNNQSIIDKISNIADDKVALGTASSLFYGTHQINLEQYEKIKQHAQGAAAGLREFSNELQQNQAKLLTLNNVAEQSSGKIRQFFAANSEGISKFMTNIGPAIQMAGMLVDTSTRSGKILSGSLMSVGGAISAVGGIWQGFILSVKTGNSVLSSIPWMAVISGIAAAINGLATLIVTPEERLEELQKQAEELSNKAKEEKANYNILNRSVEKLDELKEKRYESAEAAEEYQTAVDELANKFPEMIAGFDAAGNVILSTKNAEEALSAARQASAQATYNAIKAENEAQRQKVSNTKGKIRKTLSNIDSEIGDLSMEAGSDEVSSRMSLFYNDLVKLDENFTGDDLLYLSIEDLLPKLYNTNPNASFLKKYIDNSNFEFKIKEGWTPESILQNIDIDKLNEDQRQLYDGLKNLLTPSQFNEDVLNIQKQLNDLLSDDKLQDYSSKESQEAIATLHTALLNFEKAYGKEGLEKVFGTKDSKGLNEQLIQLVSSMPSEVGTLGGLERAEISAWNNLYNSQLSYLEKSAQLAVIATDQIQNLSKDSNFNDWIQNSENKLKVEEINKALEEFYKSLTPDDKKLLDKMLSDEKFYTSEDIVETFSTMSPTVRQYIEEYYNNSLEAINNRLKQSLAKAVGKSFNTTTNKYEEVTDEDKASLEKFYQNYYDIIKEERSAVEEQYLNSILSQYESLQSKGYTNRASIFGDAAINLFKEISQQPAAIEAQLWNLINKKGLNTLEGIQAVMDYIDQNNIENIETGENSNLKNIYNNIIPNINLAIQTATSDLFETWKDTSKELTKAMNGGVSLKEADTLIQKIKGLGLDLDLNDFVNTGDKLVLTTNIFKDYLKKLNESSDNSITQWQDRLLQSQNILNELKTRKITDTNYTEQQRAILESLNFDITLDEYWDTNGRFSTTGIKALQEAITNNQNAFNNFTLAQKIALDQLTNAYDRSQGNYKRSSQDEKNIEVEELRTIASSTVLTKNQYTERAIKEQLNSVYNTLISDVLSKGFKNINIDDYEGLIADDLSNLKNYIESGDYVSFVKNYADFTGATLQKTNDLIAQAYQKQYEVNGGDITNAIKDVTFTGKGAFGSLETIQKLATALNTSVDNIIGEYITELGAYQINANLTGINLDGIADVITDSINAFIDSIIKLISSGLNGKMSKSDIGTLKASLEQLGIKDLKLDFSETAEGFKIAEKSAISLYNALKQIDGIKAGALFDKLSNSLKNSNEHYKNISEILAHIKELNEAIAEADSKGNSARADQYREELALAEEIAAVRSGTDSNAFNFMNNKLPSSFNAPINYWNSWGKAFKAINSAVKEAQDRSKQITKTTNLSSLDNVTKLMGSSVYLNIQDFYNIVNEMNNIAKISGTKLTFLGKELNGDMKAASDLITQGLGYLSNIDGEGAKIDLSKFGVNLVTGANAMGGNIKEAINSMAHSQIDMLDGMIALLETVVQMEKLGDIDAGNDGTIDLTDLFPEFNVDGVEKAMLNGELTEWANTLINAEGDLGKAVDGVRWGEKSLRQWLKQATTEGGLAREDAEQFTAVMDSLYQMFLSGDYDLDNLMGSIKQIAGQKGFHGEITVGNSTLAIGYGVTLTKDPKSNKYTVDGKSYDNAEEALQAQVNSDIKGLLNDKTLKFDSKTSSTSGKTIEINGHTFNYELKNGKTIFSDGKKKWNDVYSFLKDQWQVAIKEGTTDKSLKEWTKTITDGKINLDYAPDIKVNTEKIKAATHNEMEEARNLVKKFIAGETLTSDEMTTLSQTVGIDINTTIDSITEEDYNKLLEAVGIESKEVDLKLTSTTDDNAKQVLEMLNSEDDLSITIKVNTEVGEDKAGVLSGDNTEVQNNTNMPLEFQAIITEYLNGNGVDPNSLVNSLAAAAVTLENNSGIDPETWVNTLHAIATTLSKNYTTDPETWVNDLGAIVTSLLNNSGINPDTWVNNLQAIATSLTNNSGVDPENWVNTLHAIVQTLVNNSGVNPDTWVNTLSAVATSLINNSNVNPDTWVNTLKAAATTLVNNSGVDPDTWVNTLSAVAISLEKTYSTDPNTWVNTLKAVAISLEKTYSTDPNDWVNKLTAQAINLLNSSGINPDTWVNNLHAIVTEFTKSKDPNELVNALTAYIKEYQDKPGVKKPTLDDLTQFINDINTEGADSALAIWRAKQEAEKIKIAIEADNSNLSNYSTIRNTLLGKERTEWSNERGTLLVPYNDIKNDLFTQTGGLPGIGYTTRASQDLRDYVGALQDYVEAGSQLKYVDQKALENLANINWSAGSEAKEMAEAAKTILEINKGNQESNIKELSEFAKAFEDINVDQLIAANEALKELAESANTLNGITWDNIANGINSINSPNNQASIEPTDDIYQSVTNSAQEATAKTEELTSAINEVDSVEVDSSNFEAISSALQEAVASAQQLASVAWDSITSAISGMNASTNATSTEAATTETPEAQTMTIEVDANTDKAESKLAELKSEVDKTIGTMGIQAEDRGAIKVANGIRNSINQMWASIKISASDSASGVISNIKSALNDLASRTYTVSVKAVVSTSKSGGGGGGAKNTTNMVNATGNIALSTGNTKTRGTLMGELGQELVVQGGRYFVVGQAGPEFVDLAPDAIVFNHLQTEQLLKHGMSSTRGRAVTNERVATAYATGNVEGPAMASAAAALAALKQIRAMWQSMLNASLSDLGQQAGSGGGSGGGGGGGGGKKKKNTIDPGFIADLERWYNLLRQIEKLEKDINYEEQLRSKIQSDRIMNGKALYESQKRQLTDLNDEMVDRQQLIYLQRQYYEKRRKELELETNYGKIFTFNEEGLMQYNDQARMMRTGDRGGLYALAKLNAQNPDSSTVLSAEQQYNLLIEWGFGEDLVYDSSGKKIDFGEDKEDEAARYKAQQAGYTAAVQAFWDKADAWKDELDGLYDGIREQEEGVLKANIKRNEILQAISENQMKVEDKIYNAIIDMREAEIKDAQKERDNLQKTTQKYINGLSQQLNRERNMYQDNEEKENLNKLRRQLGILQRSGGSASTIRNLREQISSKEKDLYFNSQQSQINAIQEASDLQLEKLDTQINLMTDQLEYQKAQGLLWNQVAGIMKGTPEEINQFITANGKEWQTYSAEKWTTEYNILNGQTTQWAAYINDTKSYWASWDGNASLVQDAVNGIDENNWRIYDQAMHDLFGSEWESRRENAYNTYKGHYDNTSDPNYSSLMATVSSKISETLSQKVSDLVKLDSQAYVDNKPKTNTKQPLDEKTPSGGGSGGSGGGGSGGGNNTQVTVTWSAWSGWKSNATKHWQERVSSLGKVETREEGPHTSGSWQDSNTQGRWEKRCTTCQRVMALTYTNPNNSGKKQENDSSKKATSTKTPKSTGGGGCFVAGTKIIMGDHSIKNIEDIKIGDIIIAYNDENQSFELRKVTKSYVHHNTPRVLEIKLSNNIILGITPGHPILTTKGWKSRDIENSWYEHRTIATWLNINDEVIGYNENVYVKEINEKIIPNNYNTYNIEVESCHTYIANGIVVHNAKAEVAFSSGGLADYTGLAMVHGSKTKPEAFLNAEETKTWREDILSGRKGSLTNRLIEFQNMMNQMPVVSSNIINQNSESSNKNVTIERAEVNLYANIANDYDAQRAGENIAEEILKIARKSSIQGIRR